jgi:hypothetical protein
VLFALKADKSFCFYIDYRKLNQIIYKDRYLLLFINKILARINNTKIFTKLDIKQVFYRIRIDPDSKKLTTFRIYYSTYKYKVLLFSLTNRPSTYQRYMNNVLFDYLDIFCTTYLDDILIYSDDLLEYEKQVAKVL